MNIGHEHRIILKYFINRSSRDIAESDGRYQSNPIKDSFDFVPPFG